MSARINKSVPFLVAALLALSLSGVAQAREIQAIKSDLDARQAAYNTQLGRVNAAKERLTGAQGALRSAEQIARSGKQEMNEALAKYRKVQQLAIEHPEISPEKDRRAYAKAKASHEEAQAEMRKPKLQVTRAQGALSGEEGKLRGIAVEIATLEAEMDAERLARLRKQLEREQTVETRGEASCGDHTIAQCKKMALAEARRLAVEQASVLIVDSASEVENFELKKDQIRTQVRGIIKSSTVLKKGFVGDSGYFYSIRAVVLGQLPEDFGKKRPTARVGTAERDGTSAAMWVETGGDTWREPITGMEFVRVPGGSFEMGCHANAGPCDDDEVLRAVRLDGFWMGKTEVTQGQWEKIMGGNPSSFKKGDNYPVEMVSWNRAQDFIDELNDRTGGKYRLPSEAEWEYACRAGGKYVKYGTRRGRLNRLSANYGKTECCFGDGSDGHLNTSPVGIYDANGLGLHDMSGNVWEWVLDRYAKSYGNLGNENPIYKGYDGPRVIRGGSWNDLPWNLRCSLRFNGGPSYRDNHLGFRLLRSR